MLPGLREPAVLVSVLLRLLWHYHDRLLAADFFQPLLHLRTTHHVWDNGQRPFCRDADGCSWTVQNRTGSRGQWRRLSKLCIRRKEISQKLHLITYCIFVTLNLYVCFVFLGIQLFNLLGFHTRCLLSESGVLLCSIFSKKNVLITHCTKLHLPWCILWEDNCFTDLLMSVSMFFLQTYQDSDIDIFSFGTPLNTVSLFTILLHLSIEIKAWVSAKLMDIYF